MSDRENLVLTERPEDGVAVVRINRPEVRNALNLATRKALAEAFEALRDDAETRAIVLTGSEQAFAAGADLKEFIDAGPIEIMQRRSERYWAAVAGTPQPVIAAVNGFALGGGLELAMCADLIIAGEGAGGTQRITRAIGKFQAMRLCLTGRPVSGTEAFQMGLVSQVVPDAEVLATALRTARDLSRLPPIAVMQIKEAVLQGQNAALDTALALERKSFQLLFASEDKREGMRAFFDKRKPVFKGE